MQELTEIDSATAHTCAAPRDERWHVLEPISGCWTWLTVFHCCNQVYQEPGVFEAPVVAANRADRNIPQAA